MEGTGSCDSSRATLMERTSHRTSQEWIAQRLLSLIGPTAAANPVQGRVLALGEFQLLLYAPE
jgi:hypothetical protein